MKYLTLMILTLLLSCKTNSTELNKKNDIDSVIINDDHIKINDTLIIRDSTITPSIISE